MIIHANVPNGFMCSQATKEKRRYTLNTRSWAKALREASEALRALDPEIAASRAKTQSTHNPLTVREAMHLWVARSENRLGKDASTIVQYRHLEGLVSEWARVHGIRYARNITSHQLETWYASPEWGPARSYDQEAAVGGPTNDVCPHGEGEGDLRVSR